MHNFVEVAKHEFKKRIRQKSFLLSILLFPLMIAAVMALSVFVAIGLGSDLPVGFVDPSSLLKAEAFLPSQEIDEQLEVRSYEDETGARAALEQGLIQGYYVVDSEYLQNSQASYYFLDAQPGGRVTNTFARLVRSSLSEDLPENVRHRLVEGSQFVIKDMNKGQEINSGNFLVLLIPFFVGFIFMISVMNTAGYMLQVITDEKENRTIEVLMTSLTPGELIGGKAAGLIVVAFSIIGVWILTAFAGLAAASRYFEPLRDLRLPWDFVGLVLLFFVPSYVLVSGIMTAIGGAVGEMRQGQQLAGMINMLFMLPYFLIALVIANPDSPLLVAFTLFPTTALVTISIRWGVTSIPAWQLATSWLLLTSTALLSVWISARIFRAGMLMYGQGLNLRAALNAVRSR